MSTSPNLQLNLNLSDINLILEGLGELPFARVYKLINTIQQQGASQLNTKEEKEAVNF